jgi:hypothetical protein
MFRSMRALRITPEALLTLTSLILELALRTQRLSIMSILTTMRYLKIGLPRESILINSPWACPNSRLILLRP